MRVFDNTSTSVEFSTIKVGECFYYDNCLFVKSRPLTHAHKTANCFCFIDNTLGHIQDFQSVIPAEVDLIVRRKGHRK